MTKNLKDLLETFKKTERVILPIILELVFPEREVGLCLRKERAIKPDEIITIQELFELLKFPVENIEEIGLNGKFSPEVGQRLADSINKEIRAVYSSPYILGGDMIYKDETYIPQLVGCCPS